jgi:Raf kinase inhibitor-like YbhB/YbcL family protein
MENLCVRIGFDHFPAKHTCDGEDVSPWIEVQGVNTPYIAIIMDDPDAPRRRFTHWLIWNIEATDHIPEDIPPRAVLADPFSAAQGLNDFGRVGYMGPCPPRGESHRFFIRVWGMTEKLDLLPGAGRIELEETLKAAATQYGEAMAVYARQKAHSTPPETATRT